MNNTPKCLYIILKGIETPDREYILGPGIIIKPLSKPLSIFDLASAGVSGFKQWAILEPICNYCTCEIESASETAIIPGYDTLNRAWLASALLVICGYTDVIPIAVNEYSWDKIAGISKLKSDDRNLPPFKGGILEFHVRYFSILENKKTLLSFEDEKWINSNYEIFNKLAANSIKFRLALQSAIDWRFSYDSRIAISRIWSGIESLFAISSELVFRISLLCSNLLEDEFNTRKQLFEKSKKLYGIRSKAVHGENLSEEQLNESIKESDELLRKLLLLCIKNGHELNKYDFEKAYFNKFNC